MSDGRRKGLDFENTVCRLLSVWYAANDTQLSAEFDAAPMASLPFRRRFTLSTPLDGHWSGAGDVLHRPDVSFPFCVECKKIEGWELDGMLSDVKWPVWAWWSQCKAQAEKVGLFPLLLFTRNRRGIYALMEEGVSQCLNPNPEFGQVLQVRRGSEEKPLTLCLLSTLTKTRLRSAEELYLDVSARSSAAKSKTTSVTPKGSTPKKRVESGAVS